MDSKLKEGTENLDKLLSKTDEIVDHLNEMQEATKAFYETAEDPFTKGLFKDLNKGCSDAAMKLAMTLVEISSKEIIFWGNCIKNAKEETI